MQKGPGSSVAQSASGRITKTSRIVMSEALQVTQYNLAFANGSSVSSAKVLLRQVTGQLKPISAHES